MRPHPIAEIFPDIEGAEFDSLVEDIKKNGCIHPLVMFQGKILDGRNRWRACQKLGVKPKTIDYRGTDPIGYVLSLNLSRRHLDASQRAMVGAKIATLGHGGDRESNTVKDAARSKGPIGTLPPPTIAKTAEILNSSERAIKRARVVNERGTPELKRAVERGDVAVSTAAKLAKAPAQVQHAAAQNKGQAAAAIAKQIANPKDEKPGAHPIRTFRGVDIPSGLLDRAARDLELLNGMDRLCRELARMTTTFEQSRPEDDPQGAPGKQRQRWRENLEMLAHLIRAEKPVSVCPYCKALPDHSPKCGVCHGKGYGPIAANLPKELLAEGDDCGIYVNGKWQLLDIGF